MILTNLKLLNFRNYQNLYLEFHPKLNIFYGKNGSGKTNLVEAIYVLGLTRSFRLSNDKLLILNNATIAKVEGNIYDRYDTNYRIIIGNDGKKVKINNNKVNKLSDYISKINIILFNPDDKKFIKDTPSIRRRSLNIDISEINISYLKYLGVYNKLLKQRNAYLKQMLINHNKDSSFLDILTDKIIKLGLKIYNIRKDFICQINSFIGEYYKKITFNEGLKIEYVSDYNNKNEEEILEMYRNSLNKDLTFGKTRCGIHVDDLKFTLNGLDLKDYGSEGEQKNAIIAYKFSEIQIFKEITGSYPILILDDLFSEIDKEKILNIFNLLNDKVQTFITTTEIDKYTNLEKNSCKLYEICSGGVVKESFYE